MQQRAARQEDENPAMVTALVNTVEDNEGDVENQLKAGPSTASTASSGTSDKEASSSTGKDKQQMNVMFWIVASVLSSTFLILINKVIMKSYEFTFVYSLTTLHFAAGAIAMELAASGCKAFTPKSIGLKENLVVAASAVGSVATMNLSLQYNSVGTYQMLKLLVIPFCMVIQFVFHGSRFSRRIVGSLVIMLLGVAAATITDVSFTTLGLLMGMLAVVTTSVFAIWQGSKQAQHKVRHGMPGLAESPPPPHCALPATCLECHPVRELDTRAA
jgi:hypothetical protein